MYKEQYGRPVYDELKLSTQPESLHPLRTRNKKHKSLVAQPHEMTAQREIRYDVGETITFAVAYHSNFCIARIEAGHTTTNLCPQPHTNTLITTTHPHKIMVQLEIGYDVG